MVAALAACATLPDEAAAIRRGCAAMKARFPERRVNCAELSAKLSAEGTQWVVTENVPAEAMHQMGATLSRKTARVYNVWGE